jgi:Cu2+-exporting ATPase
MSVCNLCTLELPAHPLRDREYTFCCPGCLAVFNILSAKNQLDNFHSHPLFQQAVRSGLISNPALLETIQKKSTPPEGQETEKLYLEIQEMWCPSCAEVIRLVLLQERGVKNCFVDYATDLASIEFLPRHISRERLMQLIRELGYRPATLVDGETKPISFSLYMRFLIAAFFSLNIMMFAYPLYATYFDFDEQGVGNLFALLSCAASLPVLTYSAWPIFKKGWQGLKMGLPGMELLVSIGVFSAFALSVYDLWNGGTNVYFDSMTAIVTFVLLGKIIEAKAKFSAKDSLIRLNRALPRRGRKQVAPSNFQFVPIKEIQPGDLVLALIGEKIVLDGCVYEGEGACDESLMTGEAIPVTKRMGDLVLGGTVVCHGKLIYRVVAKEDSSALQKIIQTIEQDIHRKTQYVRAVDKIVLWFVPIVFLIAFFSGFAVWLFNGTDPFLRFISVLLISCPCAIGIAAPLAEAHLMNGLAKMGVIVRNRGCLAFLGNETVYVFDKTGTITKGHFEVVEGLDDLSTTELSLLKGMAATSSHPIASAIYRSIQQTSIPLEKVEEFVGQGLKASNGVDHYYLGSAAFLQAQGIKMEEEGHPIKTSSVYFGRNEECLTVLQLGDSIKEESRAMLSQLSGRTILLSGDSRGAVEEVSALCGFDECYWRLTPLLKKEFIDHLKQKHIVCMVGDGINDAPALTSAHVAISVVSATDISIQVSDLLLTTDKLDVIPKICQMARMGRKIVSQNLFWAFFYNVGGIGLAAFGALTPIFAAFAMVASSLMVIFNAQRLPIQDHFPRLARHHSGKSFFKFFRWIRVRNHGG